MIIKLKKKLLNFLPLSTEQETKNLQTFTMSLWASNVMVKK